MKKILSLILALLMSASCASMAFADDDAATTDAPADEPVEDAAEEESVEDVEEDLGAYELAVKFLASTGEKNEDGTVDGIMKGKGDKFDVDANVKRYEMALFAARISTGWVKDSDWKGLEAATDFTDLEGSGAINVLGALTYVSQKGIIEGYGDGTFKPEQSVTYREALTMAVRTLGYTNLGYPWGYIEKAVKLGLTNGIEGIAYTDEATRGVAAQIIYNTLFAEEGRLALASFGVSYGWTNIMITSSIVDKYNEANYDKVDYNTPADHVAFQVINDNGTLDDKVYYVKADNAQLNLGTSAEHADELALGVPYKALFSIDADDEYVDLIYAEAYAVTASVANTGRTDDTGAAYVDNVSVAIKDHKLVEKYAASDLLSSSNKAYNATKSCIVKAPTEVKVATGTVDPEYKLYAFDFANGNILKWNEDNNEYEVAWYYSEFGGCYFNVKDDNWGNKGAGIDILDDADLAAIKAEIYEASIYYTANWIYDDATPAAGKLYNSIDLYDFDGDGDYEYALYLDNYIFGILADKDKACDHGTGISIKNGDAEKVFMSACDTCKRDGYWLGAESIKIEDAKGEYVIATYNEVTKELNIIKKIEEKTDDRVDVDTYYASGRLEGYSAAGEYVIIDGEKYAFNNDFGNFTKASGDTALLKYTDKFAELYMNYVTFYVLDGGIIAIDKETTGANASFIVVESYAGISDDGYVVVWGYSATKPKLAQYRIAVYNQWIGGDFFSYGYNNVELIKAAFTKGNVYQVESYDASNDCYYVEVMSAFNATTGKYEVTVQDNDVKYTFKSGYRSNGATWTKTTDSDTYIIIGQYKNGYAPLAVYTGRVTADDWTIEGTQICSDPIVVVNATNVDGFDAGSWGNQSIVLALGETQSMIYNGAYDKLTASDSYTFLTGANDESGIKVFDFFSGIETVSAATNLKVTKGDIYRVIDGRIISKVDVAATTEWFEIWAEMKYLYANHADDRDANDLLDTSDYLFEENVEIKSTYLVADKTKAWTAAMDEEKALSTDITSDRIFNLGLSVDNLVKEVKAYRVTDGDKVGDVKVTKFTQTEYDALKATAGNAADFKLKGDIVYTVNADGTVSAVIYVDDDATVTWSKTISNESIEDNSMILKMDDNAGIQATVTAEVTTKTNYTATVATVDKPSTEIGSQTYAVKTIAYNWVGDAVDKSSHNQIADKVYHFGNYGACDVYNWSLTADGQEVYYKDLTFVTYGDEHQYYDETNICDMIKGFSFAPVTAITMDKQLSVVLTDDTGRTYTFNMSITLSDGTVTVEFERTSSVCAPRTQEVALRSDLEGVQVHTHEENVVVRYDVVYGDPVKDEFICEEEEHIHNANGTICNGLKCQQKEKWHMHTVACFVECDKKVHVHTDAACYSYITPVKSYKVVTEKESIVCGYEVTGDYITDVESFVCDCGTVVYPEGTNVIIPDESAIVSQGLVGAL